ncbi:DUF3107 domain-containing protein [Brachybacterium sp. JHP9]|uniref:DUF3107 domain-containing protein n=1 Tax=Brachybacterium equifaecis TaxID=2910770 RepID=A0ABT0QWG8_9MICO|nr:DUF3107 domain-containing protein [Brachybacterium equifaecis]MCL6421991.1 DUF3107 domain-containing protein [Brachybacterium equifaecis]
MDIRIGLQHAPRELTIESVETPEALQETLASAIEQGTVAVLRDSKGGTVLVPGSKIAYVEFTGQKPQRVGFLG